MEVLNLALGILGVVLGLVALPAAWREWRRRRWHVLDVSAHIEPRWVYVGGPHHVSEMVGGTLTFENKGVHPVTNVWVLGPAPLNRYPNTNRPVLAPGERIDIELTEEQMNALPHDPLVELQVFDHRGRGWSWTPEARYVDGELLGNRVGLKPLAPRRPWWTWLPGGTGLYNRRLEADHERQRLEGPTNDDPGGPTRQLWF